MLGKENLKDKRITVNALTSIVAYSVQGLTIHKLFQLPVQHKDTPKYKTLSDQVIDILREELRNVELFIIDEVSMISNITFIYLYLRLCEI